MSTNARTEALRLLVEVSVLVPEIRLGQLMEQLGLLGEDDTGRTLGNLEDDQFLAAVRRHRADLLARSLPGTEVEHRQLTPA